MDVVAKILDENKEGNLKSINVEKEMELDIDVGSLLASDYNNFKLPNNANDIEVSLKKLTRDNTQLLINKIWELPTKSLEETILAELPKATFVLPRARKVPQPKPLTKWQQYAKQKGITTKKKGKSKLKWDDLLQKWIPAYGFKRADADRQKEWCVELGQNGEAKEDPVTASEAKKIERRSKNELQRMRNIAKAKNVKIPKVGVPSAQPFKDSKQLTTAVVAARTSTASLGQFDSEIPKGGIKKTPRKSGKAGRVKEMKSSKKPKAGKKNRDFRTKAGGRKRR